MQRLNPSLGGLRKATLIYPYESSLPAELGKNLCLPFMQKGLGFFLLVLVAMFFWAVVPTGCANIIPPTGGPRDTLPPRLLFVTPHDSTLNFNSNRIVFTFDEYVDLQEVQNNLLFTPTFETNPEVSVRSKTVIVRFRDSLLPNTTYLLNFGNAIRDINESNPLRNFMYTFSTGSSLDTVSLTGKVLLAENGKTDSTLIVMLHRNLTDSAVVKERPVYVARVDAAGNFRFRNLSRDTFALYALGDAGIVRRYQNKTQYFAFANEPVVTGTNRDLTLHAYKEQQTAANAPAAAAPNRNAATAERRLRYTASTGNVDLGASFTLTFQTPLRRYDSAQMFLTTDSSFTRMPFTTLLDTSRTKLAVQSQWREGTQYNLILEQDFAEDTAGRKLLKSDTLKFSTKRLSDYSSLRLRIRNIDTARKPVVLFVQNNQVVFSAPIPAGVFISRQFNPGDYELRILYDENGNGQWDPGHFFGTKRQPEIVVPVTQNISVKAAWDNEFERSL